MYNFTALLFTVLFTVIAKSIILNRSNLESKIVTPGYFTSLAGFHNVYQPNMIGPGTFWIWNNQGMLSPVGRTLTFEILLYSSCSAPAQLNITADDTFVVYLNDEPILRGNNWRNIYTANLNLNCGNHNLTIVVTQGYSQFGPGIIYQLNQDQSQCYSCGLNGMWDYSTCSCRCLTICGCASPQLWMGYPACSCRCPTRSLGSNSKAEQAEYNKLVGPLEAKGVALTEGLCRSGQFYNHQTCSCQCTPKFCRQRYIWNGNPQICQCQFNP